MKKGDIIMQYDEKDDDNRFILYIKKVGKIYKRWPDNKNFYKTTVKVLYSEDAGYPLKRNTHWYLPSNLNHCSSWKGRKWKKLDNLDEVMVELL